MSTHRPPSNQRTAGRRAPGPPAAPPRHWLRGGLEVNVKLLKQDKAQNLAFLHREFGIGAVEVEALYAYAKWNFECGNYGAAAEYLYHYRSLSTNPERAAGALWGRAAANILLQDFDAAVDDLAKLKDVLDVDTFAPVAAQLAAKALLMHASLFAFSTTRTA